MASSGIMVPKAKRSMIMAPRRGLPDKMAMPSAMRVNPQGIRKVRKPMKNGTKIPLTLELSRAREASPLGREKRNLFKDFIPSICKARMSMIMEMAIIKIVEIQLVNCIFSPINPKINPRNVKEINLPMLNRMCGLDFSINVSEVA